MPRKKKNHQVMTMSFIQKFSSCPPRNGTNSFSEALVGQNELNDYQRAWPSLSSALNINNLSTNLSETNESSGRIMPMLTNSNIVDPRLTPVASSTLLDRSPVSFLEGHFPTLCDTLSPKKKLKPQPAFEVRSEGPSIFNKSLNQPCKRQKPKRNEPVSIGLASAIEATLLKKVRKTKRLEKPAKREVISGNALDSSNPTRRKGKVRPNKKKKLTCLRKLILASKAEARLKNVDADLSDKFNRISLGSLEEEAKLEMQTKKWRSYCSNIVSEELHSTVKDFLIAIRTFQDRLYHKDQVKARAKKRYVCGFHECKKLLKAGSLKLIIVATDMEKNPAIYQVLKELIDEATAQEVEVIYAGRCNEISYWLFKKNRTSVVGILNYDGAGEIYEKMINCLAKDRTEYTSRLNQIIEAKKGAPKKIGEDNVTCLIANFLGHLKEDSGVKENEA